MVGIRPNPPLFRGPVPDSDDGFRRWVYGWAPGLDRVDDVGDCREVGPWELERSSCFRCKMLYLFFAEREVRFGKCLLTIPVQFRPCLATVRSSFSSLDIRQC